MVGTWYFVVWNHSPEGEHQIAKYWRLVHIRQDQSYTKGFGIFLAIVLQTLKEVTCLCK